MKKNEQIDKDPSNNYRRRNIEKSNNTKESYDYSDSNNAHNDILSKAKESIYKFQNQINPTLDPTYINTNFNINNYSSSPATNYSKTEHTTKL